MVSQSRNKVHRTEELPPERGVAVADLKGIISLWLGEIVHWVLKVA